MENWKAEDGLIFHITLDDGKPAQLKVGEDMQKENRGTIDLKRLARERYGDSRRTGLKAWRWT